MANPPNRRLFLRSLALLLLVGACGGEAPPKPATAPAPTGTPIEFSFGTTEGGEVSSAKLRGRATALLFVFTYDLASQVLAQRLESVLRSHVPRANGAAVVLEAPKYAVMAETFRATLALSYPVAMADQATIDGLGPFGRFEQIPTIVVLDRDGRAVWRAAGVPSVKQIQEALALGSRSGSAHSP